MMNREEEKLQQDAERAVREAQNIGSMELNEATRRGIGQGKKRASRRRATYGTGAVTVAAVAIIAWSSSLMPGVGSSGGESAPRVVTAASPQAQAPVKQAASERLSSKDFYAVGMDANVARIIEDGYMSAVNQKISKDGYTLTVLGEAMDNRKMFVAFSVKNETNQAARVSQSEVNFGSNVPSEWLSRMGTDDQLKPGMTGTYIVEIGLAPDEEYPKDATFRMGMTPGEFGKPAGAEVVIDLPFQAHPQELMDDIETVQVNQEMTVSGQKIQVKNLEFSPLGIYLDYAENEANTKRLFSLIEPKLKLKDKAGTKIENPRFIGKVYDQDTLIFEGAKIEDPSSIALSVAGISAIDPEKTRLIVNTDTGKVIQGIEGLTAVADPAKNQLIFERTAGDYSQYDQINADAFMLEDTFTDASGVQHKLTNPRGQREDRDGKMVESATIGLGEGTRTQPVEFQIRSLWNPILEAAELQIK
ncbi:hypothetical protein B9G55_11280 [Saccharibacillus sp. O16]|nr:hypothetical protein B9G55_11280 [Saccharibacillus sp. O16]